MADIIQKRRDTAANWTSANPILASGEEGYETDTKKSKVGDGTTAWTSLGYYVDPTASGASTVKVSSNDTTAGYLEDKIVVSDGTNTTNILELSTLNDGSDEDVQVQIDEAKIDHANLLNLTTGDPHTQYQLESGKSAANGYASLGATTLVPTAELATGTADNTTFLRGDGTWAVPSGSGDVSKVGTPVDNQVGVWTGDGTIEGTSGLTYNGTALDITGNITLSGSVDGIDIATDVAANTSARHSQGTDTTLGTMTADVDMNSLYQITNLAAPAALGEAIRQTANITETNLATLTGGGDTTLHDHDGITENTSARHTQGTDTALGTMAADINMNSLYQVVGLQAPGAAGEAIRQTTNITETNLETLTDDSNADALHYHDGGEAILTTTSTYRGRTLTVVTDDASAVFGNALYCAADFHYERADASATTTMPCRALAVSSGTGTKEVLLEGQICNTTWAWTAGDIYISGTTGGLTQTAPSATGDQVQRIGWALSADTIYFRPDSTVVEVA